MDGRRFDHIVRALGRSTSRRGALATLLALAAGGGPFRADAKHRNRHEHRDHKDRKSCDPACGVGQRCEKGACVCTDGGAVCRLDCCTGAEVCDGGACVVPPQGCVPVGERCAGAGRRCCDGLACASGQGGQDDIACWRPEGAPCRTTLECVYGLQCRDGACTRRPEPTPTPPCAPITCAAEGVTCGMIWDGCDGRLSCGTCDAPETCGGGGTPGRCGCTPATCAGLGRTCGAADDGCGGTLACGSCASPFTCGGSGTPGVCGCSPVTCVGGTQDPETCACLCPTGRTDCVGTCADLQTDDRHCGACGNACASGRECRGGACVEPTIDLPLTGFGSFGAVSGPTDGRLSGPYDVAINGDGSMAWVADTNHHRIAVWERSAGSGSWEQTTSFGTYGSAIGGQTDGFLNRPMGVAVNAAGTTAWVADYENWRVAMWTSSDGGWRHVGSLVRSEQVRGVAVDAAGTTAWTVCNESNHIVIWSNATGSWEPTFWLGWTGFATGPADGLLLSVTGVAVNAIGTRIWVADSGNHRITIWAKGFGEGWRQADSFGSQGQATGPQDGRLLYPLGVAVDSTGNIAWVADTGNSRIAVWRKIDEVWTHVDSLGSPGDATSPDDGRLNGPFGIAVNATGTRAWIADTGNNRVTVWA